MNAVARDTLPYVRPMRDRDLDEVAAVERQAYLYPWSVRIFRDCLRVGYSCWVAEVEGRVGGYGIMSVAGGESHILNICVRPAYQRRGVGRTLLDHLLEVARARRADTALLEVRPSNHGARRLYAEMGFSEVGMRRAYYPAPQGREDALILGRALTPEREPGDT